MQNKWKIVLSTLASIGLLAGAAASVSADQAAGAWTFTGSSNSLYHSGEAIVWDVDVPGVTPSDMTVATHITNGFFFLAQQQCWNGDIKTDSWRFATGAARSVKSNSPLCYSFTGGTAFGRGWIWDF